MTVIIVLLIIGLVIYFATRKKSTNTNSEITQKSQRFIPKDENFISRIANIPFPERSSAIEWHINAINKGLANGDIELANLSYAKLIESIRQQNIIDDGNFEDHLKTIREEYDGFRKYFEVEYPQQFLPPAERKRKEPSTPVVDNTLIYLETGNYCDLPKSVLTLLCQIIN
jgi:hypothetical protein